MEYEKVSWEMIEDYCKELASKIKASGFKPDWIVGIARGGWVPARLLSDYLENPNIASMRVEFYAAPGETLKEPIISQEISVDVRGQSVLVVDDVSDSGGSLLKVVEHLKAKGASDVRVATLHIKPGTKFKPDYFVSETGNWLLYAWEKHECRGCRD